MAELSKFAGAMVAVSAATGAAAMPVTVSQSLTLSQLLSGGSTTLQFDLGSTLSSQGLSADDVLSGSLVVYGVSDASYSLYTQYGGYAYVNGYQYVAYYQYGGGGYYVCTSYYWSGGCSGGYYVPAYYYPVYATVRDYERTADFIHHDTIADEMTLGVGSTVGSDVVGFAAPTYGGYGAPIYESSSSSGLNTYRYYRREQNVYQGYFGDLEVTLGLDAIALSDFAFDGILGASISATAGQFVITGATLTVQVDDSTTSDVPEPGSLALVAVAAGAGLAVTRRRRRGEK